MEKVLENILNISESDFHMLLYNHLNRNGTTYTMSEVLSACNVINQRYSLVKINEIYEIVDNDNNIVPEETNNHNNEE
jgi:hypothetical protein